MRTMRRSTINKTHSPAKARVRVSIKKIKDSNGDSDMHMGYNRIKAITNYYRIVQERYESLQE